MERTERWMSRRTAIVVTALVAALLAALVVHTRLAGPGDEPDAGLSRSDDNPATPMLATQFRVSTFNLLGAGHTAPGGDRYGEYTDGYTRMGWSVQLIEKHALSVVGFQEMRPVQFRRFRELTGTAFGIFPGAELADAAMANSIVWRRDVWRLVEKRTIQIPYFEGDLVRMPYVLLENRRTLQRAWFSNFHNPANPPKYGNQEVWRDKATELEIGMVNQLRRDFPTTPVFLLGDFNEREEFFCRVARRTGMNAANGGGIDADRRCVPPDTMPVDWIMGTPDVGFTQYAALRTALVRRTTDHPLVISDASIAPASVQASPVRHVVVIAVDGLRSGPFTVLPASDIPALARLRENGASTLNARTVAERTTALPNLTSLLTGRRVTPAVGGHGVAGERDSGSTVHAAAGRYTSGVFDLVHNFAGSTALFSSRPATALLDRSWDAANGGQDPYGLDDGRDKITSFVVNRDNHALARSVADQLATRPRTLTVVQLDEPDRAGHATGFAGALYDDAVQRTDRQVARILGAVNRNPATRGRTLVLLTSTHGGKGFAHTDPRNLATMRVPLVAWGPGVERGGDLYALNPHYADPGRAYVGYDGSPIRNALVANLALTALRLPSIPGSTLGFRQDLNVYAGQ